MYPSRPTLSSLGIEEIETNVCEDTIENRRILRDKGVLYSVADMGFLEVDLTSLDRDEKTKTMLERNKSILSNPRDPWSDYVPFTELPMDFLERAPAWIVRHLNKYNDAVEAGTPEHRLPYLPGRCRRHRADGSRCWSWAWSSPAAEGYCRFHAPPGSFDYGAQFQKLTDAAKARLVEMQSHALDALEELVTDRDTVPHVRLKAAENIFDRTGLSAKQELTISGQVDHVAVDPAQVIREKLSQLANRHEEAARAEIETARPQEEDGVIVGEVVEGEVIEDDRPGSN